MTYESEITLWGNMIFECLKNNGLIVGAGNGGSWSQIDHFLSELSPFCSSFGGLVVSLSTQCAFSAIANDIGFDCSYSAQLGKVACPSILVALSTSGNSKNIVELARTAKLNDYTIMVATGTGGGKLKSFADVWFESKHHEVAMAQEDHLHFLHKVADKIRYMRDLNG